MLPLFWFPEKTNETSLATIFFLEEKSLQSAAECI